MGAGLAVDAVLALLLVWIAWEDGHRFRIPNRAILALAIGFPAAAVLQGRTGLLLPHVLFALAALVALMGAFAAGICGGGDAKLLTAALLWIGPEGTFVFALLLLGAVLVYAAGAYGGVLPARRRGRRMRIPLGPCIAVAFAGVTALSHLPVRAGQEGEGPLPQPQRTEASGD